MTQHQVTTSWSKQNPEAEQIELAFTDGITLKANASKEEPIQTLFDPEQALVAAISNCHMLSFLAEAAKAGLQVTSYEDIANGILAKNESGRIYVGKVVLSPRVVVDDQTFSLEDLSKLHEVAHHNCFIANSVISDIDIKARP